MGSRWAWCACGHFYTLTAHLLIVIKQLVKSTKTCWGKIWAQDLRHVCVKLFSRYPCASSALAIFCIVAKVLCAPWQYHVLVSAGSWEHRWQAIAGPTVPVWLREHKTWRNKCAHCQASLRESCKGAGPVSLSCILCYSQITGPSTLIGICSPADCAVQTCVGGSLQYWNWVFNLFSLKNTAFQCHMKQI